MINENMMDVEKLKVGQIYFNSSIGDINKYLEVIEVGEDHIKTNFIRNERNKIRYETTTIPRTSLEKDTFKYSNYNLITKPLLKKLYDKIFSGKLEVSNN